MLDFELSDRSPALSLLDDGVRRVRATASLVIQDEFAFPKEFSQRLSFARTLIEFRDKDNLQSGFIKAELYRHYSEAIASDIYDGLQGQDPAGLLWMHTKEEIVFIQYFCSSRSFDWIADIARSTSLSNNHFDMVTTGSIHWDDMWLNSKVGATGQAFGDVLIPIHFGETTMRAINGADA